MSDGQRKVLFIGLDYHDYARAIDSEFRAQGYDSHFHSIQPGWVTFKIARRLSALHYQRLLDAYHREIILSAPTGSLDRVIFLQVHQVSHENMALLKARQPQAIFTLYNWDAVTTHDYRPHLPYFDRVFTFDSSDAQALGVGYLPLFCIRRFQGLAGAMPPPFSAYFVGNIVNPRRYEAVTTFANYARANGILFRHYLSTTVHGYTTMLRTGLRPRGVSFRPIPDVDFLTMVRSSAAVFDFANHRQTGFTMRTMENLCAGRKIITNNPAVREAIFYTDDRFFVFEDMDFSGVRDFLERPLKQPKADFSEYHVQSFAAKLLGVDAS